MTSMLLPYCKSYRPTQVSPYIGTAFNQVVSLPDPSWIHKHLLHTLPDVQLRDIQ